MGPMTIRLGNLTSRSCKGLNSIDGLRRAGVMGGMQLSPLSVVVALHRGADLLLTIGDHSRR